MNSFKDVLARFAVDVNQVPVTESRWITIVWQGKPTFVRHSTAAEIEQAQNGPPAQLIERQADRASVMRGHDQLIVLIGIFTHPGSGPLGRKASDPRGDLGGWFYPCHGSQYGTSGPVQPGPAPANVVVPPYAFVSATKIKVC